MTSFARYAASLGWKPIPVHTYDPEAKACSCSRGTSCPNAGKHPTQARWTGVELSSADIFATWEEDPENAPNTGILTGSPSGFWVLDIDPDRGADQVLADLVAEKGTLPPTRRHITGSGGLHYLFQLPEDFEITNGTGDLPSGLDVRGTGGFIVAPSSTSHKGAYTTDPATKSLPIAAAPDWLLDLLRPKPVDYNLVASIEDGPAYAELDDEQRKVADSYLSTALGAQVQRLEAMKAAATPDGSTYAGEAWNNTVYEISCNLFEFANSPWMAYSVADIEKTLTEHAPMDAGFTLQDVQTCARSAATKTAGQGRPAPDRIAGVVDWFDATMAAARRVGPTKAAADEESAAVEDDEDPTWPAREWSEPGNVLRTLQLAGGAIAWCPELGSWLECVDGLWVQPASEMPRDDLPAKWVARAMELAKRHEAQHYDATPKMDAKGNLKPGSSERDSFIKFMEESSRAAAHTAVATTMRRRAADHDVEVGLGEFDRSDFDFACANGIIDLRTGELRPLRPEEHISIASPASYNPLAKAPIFQRYLESSIPDPEVRRYLQRIVGYSLTGDFSEEVFFIHWGPTAGNGKSKLQIILMALMGEHFQAASSKALLAQRNEKSGQDFVDLRQGRLLSLSETPENAVLDEAEVKSLVSGDPRADRAHYKGNVTGRVTGKMHIFTNHRPHVSSDAGMKRRLRLVEWPVSFTDSADRDRQLDSKIIARELDGVLAWAVQGAREWWDLLVKTGSGLDQPEASAMATEMYFFEEDEVAQWSNERTVEFADGFTASQELYDDYRRWNHDRGGNEMPYRKFQERLMKRPGIRSGRTSNGHAGARQRGVNLKLTTPQVPASFFP